MTQTIIDKLERADGPDRTCKNCIWHRTFTPRRDEALRYGWETVGHECRRQHWEGYTQPDDTCEAFALRARSQGGE